MKYVKMAGWHVFGSLPLRCNRQTKTGGTMRERINRLAKGIVDPEALRLVISPAELTDTVHAGEVTRKIISVAD